MIGIIVVTHLDIATPLIHEAERVLGSQENIVGLNLRASESSQVLSQKLAEAVQRCCPNGIESAEGALILTDLYGSTPTNTCLNQLKSSSLPVEILTGVNLPMLVSALTYRTKLSVKELAGKVLADGQRGIQNVKSVPSARF
ncbi:MAG: PTS sugar transporter subunit IIA [Elusimicrobia bacterium]|nr:PTS sugar transporter subunit IIA [Elusimicrobiota bacterium]MBI4217945.1 PTS sugar transporter subunit IIA [Elusimicrobiota bacterium]